MLQKLIVNILRIWTACRRSYARTTLANWAYSTFSRGNTEATLVVFIFKTENIVKKMEFAKKKNAFVDKLYCYVVWKKFPKL